jgi:two-component system, chemotaxis family, protein-glutamate methylesterase/glutaminase
MGISSKRTLGRGAKIRVLVVDDSVVIRRLVTQALEADPRIEVVGAASNGSIALARVPQLTPDVITLDVEMPDMDGLQFLAKFRPQNSGVRVIMFSTLTERGASATMEALTLGADDYVTKVSNVGSLDRSMEALRSELIPKIKQFFEFEDIPRPIPVARKVAPARAIPTISPNAIAIGISTGGPTALGTIIPQFPADFPLPIFIVQHMPPVFTRLLAERLQASSKLKVLEATDGLPVEGGTVYIAPGDYHMRLRRAGLKVTIHLDQEAQENSCRPAVDVLFRSVNEVYGSDVVAAVLTGMGYDGLRGAEILKAGGAYVLAQDEATSVVWGMPGAVAQAGFAAAVLPLDEIVPEILSMARVTQRSSAPLKRAI